MSEPSEDDVARLRAALAVMAPGASSTQGMVQLLRVAESPAAFGNGILGHARRQMSGEIRHGSRGIDDNAALALIDGGLTPMQVASRIARLTGGNASVIAQRLRSKRREK